MTTQPFTPQTPTRTVGTNRIEVIDALRGFSLIGIVVAHCSNHYLAGMTPPSVGTLNIFSAFDKVVGDCLISVRLEFCYSNGQFGSR